MGKLLYARIYVTHMALLTLCLVLETFLPASQSSVSLLRRPLPLKSRERSASETVIRSSPHRLHYFNHHLFASVAIAALLVSPVSPTDVSITFPSSSLPFLTGRFFDSSTLVSARFDTLAPDTLLARSLSTFKPSHAALRSFISNPLHLKFVNNKQEDRHLLPAEIVHIPELRPLALVVSESIS
jgi:hypothetical protein